MVACNKKKSQSNSLDGEEILFCQKEETSLIWNSILIIEAFCIFFEKSNSIVTAYKGDESPR